MCITLPKSNTKQILIVNYGQKAFNFFFPLIRKNVNLWSLEKKEIEAKQHYFTRFVKIVYNTLITP